MAYDGMDDDIMLIQPNTVFVLWLYCLLNHVGFISETVTNDAIVTAANTFLANQALS